MSKTPANPCPNEAYRLVSPALVPTVLLGLSLRVPWGTGPRAGAPRDQHKTASPGTPSLTWPWTSSVLPEYPPIFYSQALALLSIGPSSGSCFLPWTSAWVTFPLGGLLGTRVESRPPLCAPGDPVTIRTIVLIILYYHCLLTCPIFL